jgi:hypothetical protein
LGDRNQAPVYDTVPEMSRNQTRNRHIYARYANFRVGWRFGVVRTYDS